MTNQITEYLLLRDAKVEVTSSRNTKNQPVAAIEVNGKFKHTFPSTSRVSRALETMTADDLKDRLQGGTFFFVDKFLVDYRDAHYNGFVQDDDSVTALVRVIGIQKSEAIPVMLHDNLLTHRFALGCQWDASQIVVPEYGDDGNFTNSLLFAWSPFNKDISSAFVLRQNSNGSLLRGMSSFLRKRIPLVNRWEEHLDIACKQLQVRIDSEVKKRFKGMGTERASIQELMLISDHAKLRMEKGVNLKGSVVEEKLNRIHRTANPVIHCNQVYKELVFTDKRLAAQRAGHLSVFDAYRLATEVRTISAEVEGSSALALDRFANDLIFNHHDLTQFGARFEAPTQSAFKDVEAAFYGRSV
jgi:hypothetical protein